MPDISLCINALCPSKEYCHRYTATPSEFRQSYGGFSPEEGEDKCDHFWPNSKDSTKCKLGGVKREGEMCNLDYCTYPKCVQDDYCKYCHKTDSNHKMSCPTRKITILLTLLFFINVLSAQCYSYDYTEYRSNTQEYTLSSTPGYVEFTPDYIVVDDVHYEIHSVQRLIRQEFFIYSCINTNTDSLVKIVTTDWDESMKYITMLFFEDGLHHKYCLTKI